MDIKKFENISFRGRVGYAIKCFENLLDKLKLKKLYAGIHASINTMIYQIYYLGCSHAYSVINGKGESSLVELNVILNFMYENDIEFPDIKKFEKYSITENKEWGCPFDKQDVQ